MNGSPVFALRGVEKHFGHRKVLRGIDLELPAGEFVLLLGNNGAGKTTLMRILSTLMRPTAGEVRFRGEHLHRSGERARADLGVISHESRFYPDLTAVENLRIFGRLYGVRDLKGRIAEALERVRLDDVPDVPVRAFSSGMLKRLAIGRLLLYGPQVLLLDEPYSGLDQASIRLLDEFLARFGEEGGTTVMVTHQFTAGVALANRIVLLHQGEVAYNEAEEAVTAAHCAALLQDYGGARPTTTVMGAAAQGMA